MPGLDPASAEFVRITQRSPWPASLLLRRVLRLAMEIIEARFGADFLVHTEVALLTQQAGHVAIGIVDIAEVQRVGDTGIDAGRRGTRVDAGREAVGQPEIDAIRAKRAFLGDTVAARIFALDLVL